MGCLSMSWREINYWGIVQRSELLTVNQRIMVRVHVPQLLTLYQIMHQCDYCCWYYSGNCDCPYVMKKQACENALKTKERNERPIRKVQNVSNSKTS